MKKILSSLPFLFILGLMLWVTNSLIASMFTPGTLSLDSQLFALTLNNIYMQIFVMSFSILLYMILFRIFAYERDQKLLRNAFNLSFPMSLIDFSSTIMEGNGPYWDTFANGRKARKQTKCHALHPGEACHTDKCPLTRIKNGEREVACEATIPVNGAARHFLIKARPHFNVFGEAKGIILSYNDITSRKELEEEKQRLIDELQASLEQVKLLKGMLPLCPSCKQVRDDEGYWNQIEAYLQTHSDAEITYSLCPECREQSQIALPDTDLTGDGSLNSNRKISRDTQWLKVVQ